MSLPDHDPPAIIILQNTFPMLTSKVNIRFQCVLLVLMMCWQQVRDGDIWMFYSLISHLAFLPPTLWQIVDNAVDGRQSKRQPIL